MDRVCRAAPLASRDNPYSVSSVTAEKCLTETSLQTGNDSGGIYSALLFEDRTLPVLSQQRAFQMKNQGKDMLTTRSKSGFWQQRIWLNRILVSSLVLSVLSFCIIQCVPGFVAERIQDSFRRGDYRESESLLAVAGYLFPSDPEIAFLNARRFRHLGQPVHCIEQMHLARLQGVSNRRLFLEELLLQAERGDLTGLEQRLPALLVAGDDAGAICDAFVRGCLMSYRLSDAERILNLWLKDYPDEPKALFLLGRLLEHREHLPDAAQKYRRASDIGFGPAAFALSNVLIEQHEFKSAFVQAERAERWLYDPQPAYVLLSRLHRLSGEPSVAADFLELAGDCSSDASVTSWRSVGVPLGDAVSELDVEKAELAISERDYPRAEASFRLALEKSPQRWRLRHGMATALRLQGKLQQANEYLSAYQETMTALEGCGKQIDQLRIRPDDLNARIDVAKTLMEHVSQDQGLVWLKSVLQYDPSHQEAHLCLYEFYRNHASEHPGHDRLADTHREQLYVSPDSTN